MRLIDVLDRGCAIAPDGIAVSGLGGEYTYRAVSDFTHRIALALRGKGAGETTGVSLLTPNDPLGFITILAIHRLGGVYVRLNFRSTIDEHIHILRHGEAEWLFFHSCAAEAMRGLSDAVPSLKHFVCIDKSLPGTPSLEDFAERHNFTAPILKENPGHVVMLASTGGTTGLPKLVMLTDQNFETAVVSELALMPCKGRPTYLIPSAMTHAAFSIAYGLIARGARTILLAKADPLEIMQTIERERVTHIYLPPTVIYMMLAHPNVRKFDYSSLQSFVYSAAPMSVVKLKEAIDVFGPVMTQFYGQAECPMFISVMTPEDHNVQGDLDREKRLLSCGRPTPFCSVAIMDDDGKILQHGERGEIVTRGNLVMKGYHKNDAANLEARRFGWHHTGDIGYFDAEGYLYIVDRKKDLIISGGFNIYPGEIEQVVGSHPHVQECAVIGVPHDKWGEEVRAIVQLKPGSNSNERELIDFCKATLGSVKAPKVVEFWENLPKSAAGKILKREIRDKFWKGRERAI